MKTSFEKVYAKLHFYLKGDVLCLTLYKQLFLISIIEFSTGRESLVVLGPSAAQCDTLEDS